MARKRAHIVVEGRVQGVYYRASMKREATSLGLTGWVRNLAGGDVEALVEGEKDHILRLVEWCRQGPPHAAVDAVSVEWREPEGDFDSFYIKR